MINCDERSKVYIIDSVTPKILDLDGPMRNSLIPWLKF